MAGTMVRVLEADPGLAWGLSEDARARARSHAVAPVVSLPPGPWKPARSSGLPGALGVLVLAGFLQHDLMVGGGRASELLGPGDVLRPSQVDSWSTCQSRWAVLASARLAVLDPDFAVRISDWPEIQSNLLERTIARSRSLLALLAIRQTRHLEERLLSLLWQLAGRWGRPAEHGGVLVDVPRLRHETLAALVGARRPSVTSALNSLVHDGAIERGVKGSLILHRGSYNGEVVTAHVTTVSPSATRSSAA